LARAVLSKLGPLGDAIRRHERVHGFVRAPVQVSRDLVYYQSRGLIARARGGSRVVCFAPEVPHSRYVMWKVCQLVGAKVTGADRRCDLGYAWVDWSDSDGSDRARAVSDGVNAGCTDIGKRTVDDVHDAVLGYRLALDPTTHTGPCVEKSDRNAAHDGRIVDCPIADPDPERVYQRLVHNERDDGLVEELRVPVVGSQIPFVYVKHRPIADRFAVPNSHVAIVETTTRLSSPELESVLEICARLGLDVGELDVLRDREDGRIYVIDVNRTCYGPPLALPFADQRRAVERLAEAFQQEFL
jgi:hypothetical protein